MFHTSVMVVSHVLGVQLQVVISGHLLIKSGKFNYTSHPLQHFVGAGCQGLSKEFHGSGCGLPQIGDHLHDRRFARSVRSEKPVDLSFFDVKTDIIYKVLTANGLGKAVCL